MNWFQLNVQEHGRQRQGKAGALMYAFIYLGTYKLSKIALHTANNVQLSILRITIFILGRLKAKDLSLCSSIVW